MTHLIHRMQQSRVKGGTLRSKHGSENKFDINSLYDDEVDGTEKSNRVPIPKNETRSNSQKVVKRDRNHTLMPKETKTEAELVHIKMCQEIKKTGKSKLRKVPVRLSIGGTPLKEDEVEAPPPTILNYSSVVVECDSSDESDDSYYD